MRRGARVWSLAGLIRGRAGLIRSLARLILILPRLIRSLTGLILSLARMVSVLARLILILPRLIRSLTGLILSLAGLVRSLAGLGLILWGCAHKGASPSQRAGESQRRHGGNVDEIAPCRMHKWYLRGIWNNQFSDRARDHFLVSARCFNSLATIMLRRFVRERRGCFDIENVPSRLRLVASTHHDMGCPGARLRDPGSALTCSPAGPLTRSLPRPCRRMLPDAEPF